MIKDFEVIGHVPKLMALWLTNSGKAVIKGKRVNRGGGYGLEVPCEYRFDQLAKDKADHSLRNIMDVKTIVFHLKILSV